MSILFTMACTHGLLNVEKDSISTLIDHVKDQRHILKLKVIVWRH